MRAISSIALSLFFLSGCSTSLVGEWFGDCRFSDANGEANLDVTANIDRDNGYILEGQMTIIDWEDAKHSSDLSGDHSGKYVLLKSDFDTDLGPYRFRLEMNRVGHILEGDCTVQSPDAPGKLTGSIILEK